MGDLIPGFLSWESVWVAVGVGAIFLVFHFGVALGRWVERMEQEGDDG